MPDPPQANPGRLLQDLALSVHTGAQGNRTKIGPADAVVHERIRDAWGLHVIDVNIAIGKGLNGFDSTARVVWAGRRESRIGIENESEIQPFPWPPVSTFTLRAAFFKQGKDQSRPA